MESKAGTMYRGPTCPDTSYHEGTALHPTTRLKLKLFVALVEVALIMTAAMAIGDTVPYWIGGAALALLLLERAFYITGGIGGYLSYKRHIKEALRGESDDNRP